MIKIMKLMPTTCKISSKLKGRTFAAAATTNTQYGKWIEPVDGHATGIQIYNCVSRKKVPLILKNRNQATWYSCGPTVYDLSHIGHASCYVKQDILQRILRDYFKINVVTAMNITDIDDKIISKSKLLGEDWTALSLRYEQEFWKDLQRLGVREPDIRVRVSEFVPNIIEFIQKLLAQQKAYRTEDGSVYFDVDRYAGYGKLHNVGRVDEADQPAHIEEIDGKLKKSRADFALWKATKSTTEPYWPTPWGNGRPGWHIECSVMASKLFGQSIDFHGGGIDLRFPHHENEEAQCCAHHGTEQWVNYWIHTGQLYLHGDEDKMSKSLKNTINVEELLKIYSAEEFRMLCLLTNYQNHIYFSSESMDHARSICKKLKTFENECEAYTTGRKPRQPHFNATELQSCLDATHQLIDASLKDNFSTSKCIDHILNLVTVTNKNINKIDSAPSTNDSLPADASTDVCLVQAVSNFVNKNLQTFGFAGTNASSAANIDNSAINVKDILDGIILIRSNIREFAISSKNKKLFLFCDNIRDVLRVGGVDVKDHGKMSSWSRKESKKNN